MIVNVVEILIEYISIMLCLHKAAKRKFVLDRYFFMFFVLSVLSVFVAHKYREEYGWLMLVQYINLLVYTKIKLCKRWTNAFQVFGIMLITIPSMQLIIFFSVKLILDLFSDTHVMGIIVNCIVCVLIKVWRKEYLYYIGKKLIKLSGLIIGGAVIFLVAYALDSYRKSDFIYKPVTLQSFTGVVGVGIVSVLLLSAEYDRKSKARELQLYEIYNKTFEEAIIAIRTRQHEFDNHIHAIKCLQYTIDNQEELIKAQNEYCDRVLSENSYNRLLKLKIEPILTGFIYSKLINSEEQGISVLHEVHSIQLKNIINISEFVECIGILVDNAIEALADNRSKEKKLILKILQEDKEKISIEVANQSKKYLNNEIERFCEYGYSTKGKGRGIGLTRVKEIVQKYKAEFYIENIKYDEENYLCFKLVFIMGKIRNW